MHFFMILFLSGLQVFGVEGTFEPSGQKEVLQQREVRVISHLNQKGLDQIQEFKKDGFSCARKQRWTKCRRFADQPQLPNEFVVTPNRQRIIFGPISGEQIVSENESFVQTEVHQDVSVDGETFKAVTYFKVGDVEKVRLGELGVKPNYYFIIYNNQKIGELQNYNITQEPNFWDEFMISVHYSL